MGPSRLHQPEVPSICWGWDLGKAVQLASLKCFYINLFPSYYTWNVKNPLLWIVSGRKSSRSQLVSSGEQKTKCQQLNLWPKNGKHTCCCLILPGRCTCVCHQLHGETTQLNQCCRNLFINAIYGGKTVLARGFLIALENMEPSFLDRFSLFITSP